MRLLRRLKRYTLAVIDVGLFQSLFYILQMLRARSVGIPAQYTLYSRRAKFPLKLRANSSDIDVFKQIFAEREYRCLDEVNDAGLIVDCGANVGFSAVYFLSRWPASFVIAVEPDGGNYSQLSTNLAPYAPRYRAIRSAVWSHSAGIVMANPGAPGPGGGNEWGRTVRLSRDGEEPAMTAVDIATLLETSGYDRISILKVDIEGAEEIVFGSNYESWIGKVDNLVIELHGDACQSVFEKAISNVPFSSSRSGELTVCKRRGRKE